MWSCPNNRLCQFSWPPLRSGDAMVLVKTHPRQCHFAHVSRLLCLSSSCFSLNWWLLVRIFSMLSYWNFWNFLKFYLSLFFFFFAFWAFIFHHFVRHYRREGPYSLSSAIFTQMVHPSFFYIWDCLQFYVLILHFMSCQIDLGFNFCLSTDCRTGTSKIGAILLVIRSSSEENSLG